MHVILVEAELAVARGISCILKAESTVVDHAETGDEALELARHYGDDIILGVMLPDIEGFDAIRRLRVARNNTPDQACLTMTGQARRGPVPPASPRERLS